MAVIIDISTFVYHQYQTAMRDEIYSKSAHELIQDLGKRYSEYRKRMGMTQKQVSEQSGLSIFTISSFENGSSTGITMTSLIKLLRAINFLEEIDKLLPELPVSPRQMWMKQQKGGKG